MQSLVRYNRSLTFYQQAYTSAVVNADGAVAVPLSSLSFTTANTTHAYNIQLNNFLEKLNAMRVKANLQYGNITTPNSAARNAGVKIAREYELADVMMGGKGTAGWTPAERVEILKTGKVPGEGHHLQNVANHPEQQANPDNIKFYKTRDDHLKIGHGGNWQNESDQPIIDKNNMLKKTNLKRVVKNELTGLGIAVAIGVGIGFSLSMITLLAQSGISLKTLKNAAIQSAKTSAEIGGQTVAAYGVGRVIGPIATKTVTHIASKVLTVTSNISKMINTGIVGTLTISMFSAYQFAKLKQNGVSTNEALYTIGKQAQSSLAILTASLIAQGIWGGLAGIIFSSAICIYLLGSSVVSTVNQRKMMEKIQIYTIEKHYPSFAR